MFRFILLSLCMWSVVVNAQNIEKYNEAINLKKNADEQYTKANYGIAVGLYEKYLETNKDNYSESYVSAKYYLAMSYIKSGKHKGHATIENFVLSYPDSRYVPECYFNLASLYFEEKNYSESLKYYRKINERRISPQRLSEFYFKRGYCNLKLGNTDEAVSDFYEIRDKKGKYRDASIFYYGYLSFKNAKYQTALESFSKIEGNPDYSSVIPFYIVQINYFQNDYESVIEKGNKIIDLLDEEYYYALAGMMANTYFRLGDYSDAVKFYEKYAEGEVDFERTDNYEYGYSLYKLGNYSKALTYLEKVGGDDSISQKSAYTLADCYLNNGDKKRARAALGLAAGQNYDNNIAESALFNYAKISYELSSSAFNQTINAFDDYISRYPKSARNDEAYDYLVNVYLNTGNYQAALNSMDKISYKTANIKAAYQKVSYKMALELYNKGNYNQAVSFFDKSLKYRNQDNLTCAKSLFWKAEALYELGEYYETIKLLKEFLQTPGAGISDCYSDAYYTIAYSYFKEGNFKKAIEYFKLYEINEKDESSIYLADARLRIADYYLYAGQYNLSEDYYDKVANGNSEKKVFALYKKTIALGLQGKNNEKIRIISTVISKYPESSYFSELCYEAGNILMTNEDRSEAEKYYRMILEKGEVSEFLPKAILQLGLLNFNSKKFTDAEKYYKRVIEDYPGTEYSESASLGLKNLMIETGKVDDYFNYISQKGMSKKAGEGERDSLKYISAERKYMDGDYQSAISAFKSYLTDNTNGIFRLNAYYFLANSCVRQKDYSEALIAYEKILDFPVNEYSLEAVKYASYNNYKNGNYSKSLRQYEMYESIADKKSDKEVALLGQLKSANKLKEYKTVIQIGENILTEDLNSEQNMVDVLYIMANAYNANKNNNKAKETYKLLKNFDSYKEGAEAWYRYAKILFDEGKFKDAEEEINKFMDSNSSEHYWLASGFILLSDIYIKNNDLFQARYTLKSIIENYPDKTSEIIKIAESKLKQLNDTEQEREKTIKEKNKVKQPTIKLNEEASSEDKEVEDAKKILNEMIEESSNK